MALTYKQHNAALNVRFADALARAQVVDPEFTMTRRSVGTVHHKPSASGKALDAYSEVVAATRFHQGAASTVKDWRRAYVKILVPDNKGDELIYNVLEAILPSFGSATFPHDELCFDPLGPAGISQAPQPRPDGVSLWLESPHPYTFNRRLL